MSAARGHGTALGMLSVKAITPGDVPENNPGDEADIENSRTLASLVWRFDHDRVALDARSVVILDEAGMTADIDLLGLSPRSRRSKERW
jgi:hypothetical protein